MIGMLADIAAPEAFAAQIMVGPSPCYINDGDYVGGFEREDIDSSARDAGMQLPRLVEQHGAGHHGRAATSPSSPSN